MATAVQEFRGDANRTKVVEMRLAGKTLDKIAAELGFASDSAVRYHLDVWLAEQKPSSEQTEELRQLQTAQIDSIAEKLWPQRDDVQVVDRLVKLMDRKARLMGLDLQAGVTVNVLTAEGMAAALGLDPTLVVDVEAAEVEEITDGSDA